MDNRTFSILYGSHTGQSQAIAEEIHENAVQRGYSTDLYCFSAVNDKLLAKIKDCVVIVVSSTGEGEPPDNVRKFWRFLKKKSLTSDYLSQMNFALLGLGDSNYNSFGQFPHELERRLMALDAKSYYPSALADDATGLENVVDPWIYGLWSALDNFLTSKDGVIPNDEINEKILNGLVEVTGDTVPPSSEDAEVQLRETKSTSETVVKDNSSGSLNERVTPNSPLEIDENRERIENMALTPHIERPSAQDGDLITINQNLTLKSYSKATDDDNLTLNSNGNEIDIVNLTLNPNSTDTDAGNLMLNSNGNNIDVGNLTLKLNSNDTVAGNLMLNSNGNDINIGNLTLNSDSKDTAASNLTDFTDNQSSDVRYTHGSWSRQLHGLSLNIPKPLPSYLSITYSDISATDLPFLPYQNNSKLPFCASDIYFANLQSSRKLTNENAVKTTYEFELDIKDCPFSYVPGDSFSVICPNSSEEVDSLLNRLELQAVADVTYSLSILPDTKKKNASVAVHVPVSSTLRHLFTTCLDIREPPKKAVLRILADYTADALEQRHLLELCSIEGADMYYNEIRRPYLSLLDILLAHKSCHPSVTNLIERLPRLLPRPYSASSSVNMNKGILRFTFNLIEFPQSDGRLYPRHGICSGWLHRQHLVKCSGHCVQIPVFARTKTSFHLPENPGTSLLLIGPGTGIAPFIGFLEELNYIKNVIHGPIGDVWLFFGCRHQKLDYIYREEVETFQQDGVLNRLFVSFSRDDQGQGQPRYVQDNLTIYGLDVVDFIQSNASIYVCGDARNMARDVSHTLVQLFVKLKGLSTEEAEAMMQNLRHERRYLEDIW